MSKQGKIIIAFIGAVLLAYFFIYKPYFTIEGKIRREVKEEIMLEGKVLYYVCGLPKDHKYYKIFVKECSELKLRAEYENSQQNCTPDYMGGCN